MKTKAPDIIVTRYFATIAGIECVVIGAKTDASAFRQELRANEVYHHIAGGFIS